MKEFILEDNFIKSITKHKNILNDFYEKEINNLFFNNLGYENYRISFINKDKHIQTFSSIIDENKELIISDINIGRINNFKDRSWFIAHQHLSDMDSIIYHYVVKCDNNCGMIIKNEYLKYHQGLIFGFKANKKHIAFNFGDSFKDSFIFIIQNNKYSIEDCKKQKIYSALNNDYMLKDMNKRYALKKIKKFLD
jgi:hypothetical protein